MSRGVIYRVRSFSAFIEVTRELGYGPQTPFVGPTIGFAHVARLCAASVRAFVGTTIDITPCQS